MCYSVYYTAVKTRGTHLCWLVVWGWMLKAHTWVSSSVLKDRANRQELYNTNNTHNVEFRACAEYSRVISNHGAAKTVSYGGLFINAGQRIIGNHWILFINKQLEPARSVNKQCDQGQSSSPKG